MVRRPYISRGTSSTGAASSWLGCGAVGGRQGAVSDSSPFICFDFPFGVVESKVDHWRYCGGNRVLFDGSPLIGFPGRWFWESPFGVCQEASLPPYVPIACGRDLPPLRGGKLRLPLRLYGWTLAVSVAKGADAGIACLADVVVGKVSFV